MVMIYFIYVQHINHKTDNARKFGLWFDDKLREVYATNEFTTIRNNSNVCS